MFQFLRSETSQGFWRELSVQQASEQLQEWCGWLYSPEDEGPKVRWCLDLVDVNALSHCTESFWMPGIDGVIALLASLRQHMGRVPLQFCLEDWKHGFRQLAISCSDARLLCALGWDAERRQVRVFVPSVHLLGPRGAPNQFARTSKALIEIANVWLAIPAVVHMDDAIILDTQDYIAEARDCFVRLA